MGKKRRSPPAKPKKGRKFQAYFCLQCGTICDSDEEAAYCTCTTVAVSDVRTLLKQKRWRLVQINISTAFPNKDLPLLKRAKKGEIQDVQE
jgi:hypothetical protein